MGTNFYRKRIPSEEDITILHRLVDEKKFESHGSSEGDPKSSVVSYIHYLTKTIHIGKRSGGWKFSFDANKGEYYKPTRKSLDSWLREDGYKIVDEYGQVYTPDEFWREVDDWNSDPNNWRTSRHTDVSSGYYMKTDSEFWKSRGYDVQANEFISDGLRFAVYTNFC